MEKNTDITLANYNTFRNIKVQEGYGFLIVFLK